MPTKKNKFKYKLNISHLLIFAVILFIGTLILIRKGKLFKNISPSTTDNQPVAVVKKEEKIEISGVAVNDFISQKNGEGSSSYYTISQTADFHIFYIPAQELFYVSITSYPFDENRIKAEDNFLAALGIEKKEEACKLKVDITTPMYANPDKAGEVYRLSWCE